MKLTFKKRVAANMAALRLMGVLSPSNEDAMFIGEGYEASVWISGDECILNVHVSRGGICVDASGEVVCVTPCI